MISSSMALANSSTDIFEYYSWYPQMALSVIDNIGQSPESVSASVAGSCGGWLCGSSSASLLDFAAEDDDCKAWIDQTYAETVNGRMMISSPENSKRRQKHPILDCDLPSPKRRCGNGITRTAKDKQSPSKNPQSIAAKNRRERISERLRILQGLVPNGAKVDLVTMLEKAINYVKFLKLQVKVLATDEFWPAQEGIAPDVAQVREAIDAVLSSSRDGNPRS
ncbi:hypothetical protein ZIOFF_038431 [Zingiber officinale]|uniref:BHLH domain-containing protein n=1 Tax=Zingiber officinale TaxID=94328 RepID=A0A8J5G9V5_ZINOF|nr:hypothetical protein ZIOFF_038431 [Zingiber officinale]